jgi:hypothetical protein
MSWALVWSVSTSTRTPRRASASSAGAAFIVTAIESARPSARAASASRIPSSSDAAFASQ